MKLRKLLTDPKFIKTINGWFVILWATLVVPTLLFWSRSVLWVALLSIWANLVSHYTAWLAARVEVRTEKLEDSEGGGT